jgi:hypothetical protein
MPSLEYFLVAESSSLDRDTNAISIFNVYNERRKLSFPHEIERIVLVTCWYSTPDEIAARRDMQAEIVMRIPRAEPESFTVNFTCDVEFQHVLFEMVDVGIPGPCLLEIELKVNGQHQAWHRIRFAED